MRDRQASIHSSLQGPQTFISSSSSGKPCIQTAGEGTWLTISAFCSVSMRVHEHKLHKLSYLLYGISNLTNDISLSYMNYHPIFGFPVLIFILDYHAFLSTVISFDLSSSSKFHLVSLEVGLILDNFNKPHPAEQRRVPTASHRPVDPAPLRVAVGWGSGRSPSSGTVSSQNFSL